MLRNNEKIAKTLMQTVLKDSLKGARVAVRKGISIILRLID
jgi:hypothetical protein